MFRQNLEETGMSYALEVAMIAEASSLDLLTTPYVFSEADAVAMTEAGADIIVCHMGLTTGGSIGAETALTLDDCVERIDAWADAARSVRPDVIVLCHGGPDRHAGRRDLRAAAMCRHPRVLRRIEHGASPDRTRAHRADPGLQGDHVLMSNHLMSSDRTNKGDH